jgi:hypothetical protein
MNKESVERSENQQDLSLLINAKQNALEEAIQLGDNDLIVQRMDEYQAFMTEVKFTDSLAILSAKEIGLKLEAEALNYLQNAKNGSSRLHSQPLSQDKIQQMIDSKALEENNKFYLNAN